MLQAVIDLNLRYTTCSLEIGVERTSILMTGGTVWDILSKYILPEPPSGAWSLNFSGLQLCYGETRPLWATEAAGTLLLYGNNPQFEGTAPWAFDLTREYYTDSIIHTTSNTPASNPPHLTTILDEFRLARQQLYSKLRIAVFYSDKPLPNEYTSLVFSYVPEVRVDLSVLYGQYTYTIDEVTYPAVLVPEGNSILRILNEVTNKAGKLDWKVVLENEIVTMPAAPRPWWNQSGIMIFRSGAPDPDKLAIIFYSDAMFNVTSSVSSAHPLRTTHEKQTLWDGLKWARDHWSASSWAMTFTHEEKESKSNTESKGQYGQPWNNYGPITFRG